MRRLVLALAAATLVGVGVAHAAGITVTSKHLYAQNQAVTHTACNRTSANAVDTWVDKSSPTSSAGGSATTLSINNKSSALAYAFIRFDLSGCSIPTSGGADSAVLTVVVTAATAGGHTISVFPVYSSWDGTLTWNGSGGLTVGATATGSFANSVGTKTITVTADVDAAIKAGALWGWELRDTAGSGNVTTTLGASENATAGNRPSMSLTDEK